MKNLNLCENYTIGFTPLGGRGFDSPAGHTIGFTAYNHLNNPVGRGGGTLEYQILRGARGTILRIGSSGWGGGVYRTSGLDPQGRGYSHLEAGAKLED
jgi:hypothetical protein